MPTFVLTDATRNIWAEDFLTSSAMLGLEGEPAWSVSRQTLRGGRRDGVDLVRLHNGTLALDVVPTRGMGLWRAQLGADRLGWGSPVVDGPVNPAYVNLADLNGIGWLHGFDELMVRCGLTHNGAPYQEGGTTFPLHGRIANQPAHHVAVRIDDAPPHAITLEGHVDEAWLFGSRLRMATTYTTVPGSNRVTVRDVVTNLGDRPADFQLLYHWNFGPPHLGPGARLVAPAKLVVPRDARAVEGLGHYDTYGPPEPGFAEQVYFFELLGAGADGSTVTLLRGPEGTRGVALRFATSQLPCFTLWKNSGGPNDGYVTGLEPATNYPNPKPFEAARDRVLVLPAGGAHVAETTLEVLDTAEGVAAVEAEIAALQSRAVPRVHERPVEPYAPE